MWHVWWLAVLTTVSWFASGGVGWAVACVEVMSCERGECYVCYLSVLCAPPDGLPGAVQANFGNFLRAARAGKF